jgi:hypothetical protein
VESADDGGRIVERADVVELDVARRHGGRRRLCLGQVGRDHASGAPACSRSLEPGEQGFGVADGRGEADALHGAAHDALQALQYGEQVPAAVVTGEGMDLVDDHGPQAGEEGRVVDIDADQHGFQRLGGGEQHVWPGREDAPPRAGRCVAVPQGRGPAEPGGVGLHARQQVVEQRLERTHVQHRCAGPALGVHPGQ